MAILNASPIELKVERPYWRGRRNTETDSLDAYARTILEAEHGKSGHRPGDRPDLCKHCAAGPPAPGKAPGCIGNRE